MRIRAHHLGWIVAGLVVATPAFAADLSILGRYWYVVLLLALGLMVGKAVLLFSLCRAFRQPIDVSLSVAAYLQTESLQMVALVALASSAIATLVGTVIATWMTGRIARMNAAAVFVSLLFWGWLWGVWGLLLGVPVVVIVKVVAEKVEGMEVVAELLGE